MFHVSSRRAFALLTVAAICSITTSLRATTETFETFTPGTSVNGQSGWTVADAWGNVVDFNPAAGIQRPDEQVVDLGGNKVWRLSNAYTNSSYSDQSFSQKTPAVAGESGSSLWNDRGPNHTTPYNPPHFGANATTNVFHSSWDFRSVTGAAQTGLTVALSPSAKQSGVRMSLLNITDTGSGFTLNFYDTVHNTFNLTPIATGLSYGSSHNISLDILFADGVTNDGGQIHGNDIVNVYVDGVLAHTGTTWESYYYNNERIIPTDPRLQAVDSLLFRVSGTAAPANLGNGLYFDNVHLSNEIPVVPEPASLSVLAIGASALLLRRRKN